MSTLSDLIKHGPFGKDDASVKVTYKAPMELFERYLFPDIETGDIVNIRHLECDDPDAGGRFTPMSKFHFIEISYIVREVADDFIHCEQLLH